MDNTEVEQIGQAVIGATVAAVESNASVTATLDKASEAATHDVTTFVDHNPELGGVIDAGTEAVTTLAQTHGLGTVLSVLEGLMPFLASLFGTKHIVVPPSK